MSRIHRPKLTGRRMFKVHSKTIVFTHFVTEKINTVWGS